MSWLANSEGFLTGLYPFSILAAQTLNSGILEMGSSAGFVNKFARAVPPQWNGTNSVS